MSDIKVTSDDLVSGNALQGLEIGQEELSVIGSLLDRSSMEIDVIIDPHITAEEFHRQFHTCCVAHNRIEGAMRKIRPIIGKFMAFVQERPVFLEKFIVNPANEPARPVKNFTEFMSMWIPENLRVARSDAWTFMSIAKEYPHLSPDKVDDIGIGKLKILAKAIPSDVAQTGKVSPAVQIERDKYLGLIEDHKLNHDSLKKVLADNGIISEEQATFVRIEIAGSLQLQRQWKQFKSDPDVIRYVGSNSENKIFEALLAECEVMFKSGGMAMEA
jgi:hypothetical protein